MYSRLQFAVSPELAHTPLEDSAAQLEGVHSSFSGHSSRGHNVVSSPWPGASSQSSVALLPQGLEDLGGVAQPASRLLHWFASPGLLPILALVAHHAPYAIGLEQLSHLRQLPRHGIGGVLVEKIPASLCLQLVQLATEAHVQLSLSSAPLDVLRRPAKSCGIQSLPAAERRAGRAANQQEWLLLQQECPGLSPHVWPGEVPRVAVLVFARQVQRKARDQLHAGHQLERLCHPRGAVDLRDHFPNSLPSFTTVSTSLASQRRHDLHGLSRASQQFTAQELFLLDEAQHKLDVVLGLHDRRPPLSGQLRTSLIRHGTSRTSAHTDESTGRNSKRTRSFASRLISTDTYCSVDSMIRHLSASAHSDCKLLHRHRRTRRVLHVVVGVACWHSIFAKAGVS